VLDVLAALEKVGAEVRHSDEPDKTVKGSKSPIR
jgi:hypothetical protein